MVDRLKSRSKRHCSWQQRKIINFRSQQQQKTETNKCEKFCKTNDDGRICHYKTIWERVSGKSAAAPVKRVPPHFCFFFQAENSKTYANIEND